MTVRASTAATPACLASYPLTCPTSAHRLGASHAFDRVCMRRADQSPKRAAVTPRRYSRRTRAQPIYVVVLRLLLFLERGYDGFMQDSLRWDREDNSLWGSERWDETSRPASEYFHRCSHTLRRCSTCGPWLMLLRVFSTLSVFL